jgi:hypothetical protein
MGVIQLTRSGHWTPNFATQDLVPHTQSPSADDGGVIAGAVSKISVKQSVLQFTTYPPAQRIDELWTILGNEDHLNPLGSSSGKSYMDTIRDWSGYLSKGECIGGGGFGDVYRGLWINL